MYIKSIGMIAFMLLSNTMAMAQFLRGAEFDTRHVYDSIASVRVQIYNTEPQQKPLMIDWGDGTQSNLNYLYALQHPDGLYKEYYSADHFYDTSGIMILTVQDSFLVDGIINIPGSGAKSLTLQDSLFIFPADYPYWATNNIPGPGNSQYTIDVDYDSGIISHNFSLITYDPIPSNETYEYEIVPFPAEGYTLPSSLNGITMSESMLIWDRPIEPGIFAIGIKMREWLINIDNPNDSMVVSTLTRAMTIEVDESMIVTSSASNIVEGIFSIYPNPATDVLHLDFVQTDISNQEDTQLKITDINGREMFSQKLSLSSQPSSSLEINVQAWPAGVYLLNIQAAGEKTVVRKFVVE